MYYNTRENDRFVEGQRAGLEASSLFARLAWSRADANAQRDALRGDEDADAKAYAMRERYRVAHREKASFESDLEETEEYGDLDEYGYAA